MVPPKAPFGVLAWRPRAHVGTLLAPLVPRVGPPPMAPAGMFTRHPGVHILGTPFARFVPQGELHL